MSHLRCSSLRTSDKPDNRLPYRAVLSAGNKTEILSAQIIKNDKAGRPTVSHCSFRRVARRCENYFYSQNDNFFFHQVLGNFKFKFKWKCLEFGGCSDFCFKCLQWEVDDGKMVSKVSTSIGEGRSFSGQCPLGILWDICTYCCLYVPRHRCQNTTWNKKVR